LRLVGSDAAKKSDGEVGENMAVKIFETPVNSGLILPDEASLERLLKIIAAAHPWLMTDGGEDAFDAADLGLAFKAVGGFFRRPTTDRSRYFHAWVALARELVGERLDPRAFLAACILDRVVWQKHEPSRGAVLELGLDAYRGSISDNYWRQVCFHDAPVPAPVVPRPVPGAAPDGLPTFSLYRV
jgi:hypothetical protein